MDTNIFEACSIEPIHTLGKIQAHGFLVIVDRQHIIRFCSENVQLILHSASKSLIGKPITQLNKSFQKEEHSTFLKDLIDHSIQTSQFMPLNPYQIKIGDTPWNLILSKSNSYYLLDFEPERLDLETVVASKVGSGLSEILADRDLQKVLNNAASQIKSIIAYDRVMIYKFHPDEHGEVVAEARAGNLETWLGLHYPASDIPAQARILYQLNWTRLIADISQPVVNLVGLPKETADLTYSQLRAVSPIHLLYLKHMGVASSFSVSIIVKNKLWGLVACHNYTPRFINFRQRESAKLIGQVLSSCIELRQDERDQKHRQSLNDAINTFTRSLFLDKDPVAQILIRNAEVLMSVFQASGMAFYYEGEMHLLGNTPSKDSLQQILATNYQNHGKFVFSSNRLSDYLPNDAEREGQSGFIITWLHQEMNDCLVLFRPEKLTQIRWAGKPEKIFEKDKDGIPFISPRHSFSLWIEEVSGTSQEWLAIEKEALLQLRSELNLAIGRRILALRLSNEKLRDAYAELDSFAHTISHDLKTPLTAIKGFADLIYQGMQSQKTNRMMAARIKTSAEKMQHMIETVLHYSKAGQLVIHREMLDMTALIQDICGQLIIPQKNQNLSLEILETPNMLGDPIMIFQVFLNVIENAVKYSHKVPFPKVIVRGIKAEHLTIYTVADNGIGINLKEQDDIFKLFSRLGDTTQFDGSGIGLSIVKKIMDRHGASISVESTVGIGTTFTLSFPNNDQSS